MVLKLLKNGYFSMFIKRFFILLLLLTGAMLILTCGGPGTIHEGKVYRWYMLARIKGFDPTQAEDVYSSRMVSQIFDTLYQFHYLKRPYEVIPNLASSMPDISEDKLVYTIPIKKGIVFQDDPCFGENRGEGRELTADDVVFSIKRNADVRIRSLGWWLFDGRIKGLNEFREKTVGADGLDIYDEEVEGLKAVDRYTLRVELNEPFPQFIYVLTMSFSAIVASEAVEFYSEEFLNHPVGTGGFMLIEWIRGSKLVLEKSPTFREEYYPEEGEEGDYEAGLLKDAGKRLPLVDRLEIAILTEEQPRWLEFLSGNLDELEMITKDNFDQAMTADGALSEEIARKGIVILKKQEIDVFYIGFNMDDPVVGTNKKLRQAISLAEDTSRLLVLRNHQGIPAESPIPPGLPEYNPNLKNPYRRHNVEAARRLLEEAGYPGGRDANGQQFTITLDVRTGTLERQISELFVDDMRQLGIEINVIYNTWPALLEKLKERKTQLFSIGWIADYPDAETFMQLFYGPNSSPGSNASNYNNPEYNELYEKIRVMMPGDERTENIHRMVDILIDDCPWIFQYHRHPIGLYYKWTRNVKYHDFGYNLRKYRNIDVEMRKGLTGK